MGRWRRSRAGNAGPDHTRPTRDPLTGHPSSHQTHPPPPLPGQPPDPGAGDPRPPRARSAPPGWIIDEQSPRALNRSSGSPLDPGQEGGGGSGAWAGRGGRGGNGGNRTLALAPTAGNGVGQVSGHVDPRDLWGLGISGMSGAVASPRPQNFGILGCSGSPGSRIPEHPGTSVLDPWDPWDPGSLDT